MFASLEDACPFDAYPSAAASQGIFKSEVAGAPLTVCWDARDHGQGVAMPDQESRVRSVIRIVEGVLTLSAGLFLTSLGFLPASYSIGI